MTIFKVFAALAALMIFAGSVEAEPFRYIRIGDQDGFGFRKTKGLMRGGRYTNTRGAADVNGDGILRQNEFMPDLNGDGLVAWFSEDNFDNRFPGESVDRAHGCKGCLKINPTTSGSIWTDLSLSASSPNFNWPDKNGPLPPNNAIFLFDFVVKFGDIPAGASIFFNLVFGDYDVDPAIIHLTFANAPPRTLALQNQGVLDGLIQARSSVLNFDEVFTKDPDGNWHGLVHIEFDAPLDPYTAFDFVELSLFQIAESQFPSRARGATGFTRTWTAGSLSLPQRRRWFVF